MRSLALSLALGAGALGIVGATPSEAKAFWIMTGRGPVNVSSYQNGPYGTFFAYNNTIYQPYVNPWGFGSAHYLPASYRYAYSPSSISAMYTSRSMVAYNYNAWYGYMMSVSTPAYYGYTITPYAGYRQYYVPGVNYTMPAASYYSGYVPIGYIR
jgi:hypothetical protein